LCAAQAFGLTIGAGATAGVTGIENAVGDFVIHTLSTLGYFGIVLLMAIESACIPLPSEVIMPFSGFLVAQGTFSLWGAALAGAVGCTLGSTIAYVVGALGGRRLALRYGRFILLSAHDIDLADRWFRRFGEATVFFTRLMPLVRTFISLPAGIAKMPFVRFIVYSFLGSLIWSAFLAYIGMQLGAHWDQLKPLFRKFDVLFVVVIVLLIAWYIYRHVRPSAQEAAA
jgi:membrane protein DedA with SNARE-associated domain